MLEYSLVINVLFNITADITNGILRVRYTNYYILMSMQGNNLIYLFILFIFIGLHVNNGLFQ